MERVAEEYKTQLASLRNTSQDDREELQVRGGAMGGGRGERRWERHWSNIVFIYIYIYLFNRISLLFFNLNLMRRLLTFLKKKRMLLVTRGCWRRKHKNMLLWWRR